MTKEQIKELMEKANKHVGKMLDMASPEWKEHDLAIRHLQKALPDIAQTALDALEENKKLRAIVTEMQRALENDPSLKLDIYGMAFYADTGIWPLFKSMPIAMNGNRMMSDEERSSKYMEWMDSIFKKPSKTP